MSDDRHQFDVRGFVPIEEIHNVFTEGRRELDENVLPINGTYSRDEVVAHFDSLYYELMKRAKANLADVVRRNPGSIISDVQKKADQDAEYQRNQDTWRRRTQMGREYARNPDGAK